MSVYFFSTVWAFAENPTDLDSITNEEMIQLAIQSRGTASKEAKKERAGEIDKRTPHMMKIHAGGSYGHCMCTEELSALHPNVLFIEIDGADCSDDVSLYFTKEGLNIFKCEIEESTTEILPGGLMFKELGTVSYEKIKLAFDEIAFMGNGILDEMSEPPLCMDDDGP